MGLVSTSLFSASVAITSTLFPTRRLNHHHHHRHGPHRYLFSKFASPHLPSSVTERVLYALHLKRHFMHQLHHLTILLSSLKAAFFFIIISKLHYFYQHLYRMEVLGSSLWLIFRGGIPLSTEGSIWLPALPHQGIIMKILVQNHQY